MAPFLQRYVALSAELARADHKDFARGVHHVVSDPRQLVDLHNALDLT
jgi:hypothetical protein